jgi:predicted alpha/beta superfamily hydrolase
MGKWLAIFFLLFISCKSHSYQPAKDSFTIHSKNTKDDYVIQIKIPRDFSELKEYTIVYVADGLIGTGKYILGVNSSWAAIIPSNCIIVTIGHKGNWEQKRRRDFIPSDAGGHDDENFGHADRFYSFLKTELIPFIEKKFPNQKTKAFIGHSFSGLFCLYAALQNEGLFDQYFAISPSVWANGRELLKIEKDFIGSHSDFNSAIHIYAGSLEQFNKVLSSTKDFIKLLKVKQYKSLDLSFEVIPWANHFSVRKPAIDKILASLDKQ